MIAKEPSLVKIFSSMLKGVCSTIKKLRWRRPRKCWEAKEIVREIRKRMHTCVEGNLNLYCHDIYREWDQHYFHRERSKERISCCNYKELNKLVASEVSTKNIFLQVKYQQYIIYVCLVLINTLGHVNCTSFQLLPTNQSMC